MFIPPLPRGYRWSDNCHYTPTRCTVHWGRWSDTRWPPGLPWQPQGQTEFSAWPFGWNSKTIYNIHKGGGVPVFLEFSYDWFMDLMKLKKIWEALQTVKRNSAIILFRCLLLFGKRRPCSLGDSNNGTLLGDSVHSRHGYRYQQRTSVQQHI